MSELVVGRQTMFSIFFFFILKLVDFLALQVLFYFFLIKKNICNIYSDHSFPYSISFQIFLPLHLSNYIPFFIQKRIIFECFVKYILTIFTDQLSVSSLINPSSQLKQLCVILQLYKKDIF